MATVEGYEQLQGEMASAWRPGRFTPLTPEVRGSEPCWGIAERVELWQGVAIRVQYIYVLRAGEFARCMVPLGGGLDRPDFDLFAGFEHSVAEVRDWANEQREDRTVENRLAQMHEETTLFTRYEQKLEEDVQTVKNRSQFGPAGKTQRNGFHHKTRSERGVHKTVFQSVEIPRALVPLVLGPDTE